MARFSEVFRCSGVDESPNVPGKSKDPGMVIPAGGWNIVALEDGERLRVHSEKKHIRIEELEDTVVIKLARLYLNFKLAWQDVDPQLRDSYMPHILSGNLISSDPIFLDDREKSIREDIAKALGLTAMEASFPENVDTGKLRNIFNKLKNPKADLTIFVVQKIQSKISQPNGVTDGELGFCVLAGSHRPNTAAHEAGHFLFGDRGKDGKWVDLGHPWLSMDPDKTPLMRDGGAGFKIQFDLALQARTFFKRHG